MEIRSIGKYGLPCACGDLRNKNPEPHLQLRVKPFHYVILLKQKLEDHSGDEHDNHACKTQYQDLLVA